MLISGGTGDHPRLRGYYSAHQGYLQTPLGSPPLARVLLSEKEKKAKVNRITPACAGTTELAVFLTSSVFGSPPLARVLPSSYTSSKTTIGITPACAGTTSCYRVEYIRFKDHPRLRGYYLKYSLAVQGLIGSPPLARVLLYLIC